MRSEFDSLHESLCDISSKLDLLSLPSSQAAPDLPNADLQSPQSLVASNFFCQDCPPRKPPLPLPSPPIHPNPLPLPSSQNNSLLPLPQAPPLFQPLTLSHPPPHPRPSSFQNGLLPLPQVPPPRPLPQTIYPPLPLSLSLSLPPPFPHPPPLFYHYPPPLLPLLPFNPFTPLVHPILLHTNRRSIPCPCLSRH